MGKRYTTEMRDEVYYICDRCGDHMTEGDFVQTIYSEDPRQKEHFCAKCKKEDVNG